MGTRRRTPPGRAGLVALRVVSLLMIIAVGAAVYLGYSRVEQQDCLNRAFQASLDERARTTDDLIDALLTLQGDLAAVGDDTDAQTAERREFVERVIGVQEARARVQVDTRARQEADCA